MLCLPAGIVQIEVFVLSGERGWSVWNFCQGSPSFGIFFQEEGGRGRVCDLVVNFDKDLLVWDCVYLGGS